MVVCFYVITHIFTELIELHALLEPSLITISPSELSCSQPHHERWQHLYNEELLTRLDHVQVQATQPSCGSTAPSAFKGKFRARRALKVHERWACNAPCPWAMERHLEWHVHRDNFHALWPWSPWYYWNHLKAWNSQDFGSWSAHLPLPGAGHYQPFRKEARHQPGSTQRGDKGKDWSYGADRQSSTFVLIRLIPHHIHQLSRTMWVVNCHMTYFKIKVQDTVAIGTRQMQELDKGWPKGFRSTISEKVKTVSDRKRHIKVGSQKIYDTSVIYSRVIGIQASSRDIDIKKVLRADVWNYGELGVSLEIWNSFIFCPSNL